MDFHTFAMLTLQSSLMKRFTITIKRLALGVAIFTVPLFALADLPTGQPVTFTEIDSIIRLLLDFIIGLSTVLMVMFIVISGIMTMTAGSDTTRFKNGLLRLKHAIIGAAVIIAAGVIINTVYALVDRSFFCQVSTLGICFY